MSVYLKQNKILAGKLICDTGKARD